MEGERSGSQGLIQSISVSVTRTGNYVFPVWPYGLFRCAYLLVYFNLEIIMATSQDKQFFNLHTSGVGYLNRVRWVQPGKRSSGRRSEPFLACSISALRGDSDDVSYTYFDVRVSGEEAIEIIDKLREAVDAQRKVIVSFRIGDTYPHLYERDARDANRRPTGQKEMAVLIKGRLLLVNSVSVDGENVYTRGSREKPAAKADSDLDELREFWDSRYADEAPVREEALA